MLRICFLCPRRFHYSDDGPVRPLFAWQNARPCTSIKSLIILFIGNFLCSHVGVNDDHFQFRHSFRAAQRSTVDEMQLHLSRTRYLPFPLVISTMEERLADQIPGSIPLPAPPGIRDKILARGSKTIACPPVRLPPHPNLPFHENLPRNGIDQAAFATWPLFLVTAANFTGFTVRLPAVRVWFRWLCEISFCRWPYEVRPLSAIVLREKSD